MTDLVVRKIDFDLDGDVPFLWNPSNPAFSLQANAISFLAIAFEKFVVAAVREAMPQIEDPEVLEEARAFVHQEAQHSKAHRAHADALARAYPGLAGTLDEAIEYYQRLAERKSLAWRLAFLADMEATFTPFFKMLLDHERTLFRAGDERVASLFLWHFCEEVEHRSSGLIIYQEVVRSRWYRTAVVPSAAWHSLAVMELILEGFNRFVPLEDRVLDARVLSTKYSLRTAVSNLLPWRAKVEIPSPFPDLPKDEAREMVRGLLDSQSPFHDPGDQPLPSFADVWFEHFESGGDVAHFYSSLEGRQSQGSGAHAFHPLPVASIEPMSADSVAITFDVPDELADLFTYEPGQHVSIRAVVDGEDVRRTYSIYPARSEKRLAVGIKRSPGGQFSSYAVDRLRVGDVLGVAPPTGRFSVPLEESLARHHVGIAGGSGVGPVLSVLATTLEEEPLSRFTLLHANRDAASRMFTADLERLAAAHPGRLQVLDVLEDTHGRLDLPMLRGWVEDGTLAEVDAWFVCGPDAMADAVTSALGDLGVDPGSVHAESYTPGAARAGEMSAEAAAHADATLSFVLGGEELSVPVAGRTVLDAALATGRDVPWSCRSGLCGTCQARLCSGSVEMAHNDVLSDAEIDAGLILTCQSRPTSDAVRVDYDR